MSHQPEKHLLRDLRELARIEPDVESTARALDRARTVLSKVDVEPNAVRARGFMTLRAITFRTVAGVAAALLVMVVLASLLPNGNSNATVAFAQVQQQIEQVKTAQYRSTRRSHVGQNRRLDETRRVMILGRYRMREEVIISNPDEPWSADLREYTDIKNIETGRLIVLLPRVRQYSYPQVLYAFDLVKGGVTESPLNRPPAKPPTVDLYQRIRDVPANATKPLPARMLNGKCAVGFQEVKRDESPDGTNTWTKNIWVDPQTRLPVRIESLFRSTHPGTVDTDFIMDEFIFDAPLDESLFSTDPPEGYQDRALLHKQKEGQPASQPHTEDGRSE